ncbi:MAG: transcriptional regulator CysB, partial [gamma proteobacterium symbiont of Stewartia floridana]
MELRQLTSLVALEESGFNVTLAAKQLFLVQSAVSQHLAQLEHELGTQLFMRKGKRLIGLTAAGEQVLNYARQ